MIRNVLTMTEDMFQRLDWQLSRQPCCENLAVGYLGLIHATHQREFLLRDDYLPGPDDYRAQTPYLVSLKAEHLTGVLARSPAYVGVLLAHNHLGQAFASSTDDTGIAKFARNLRDFAPDCYWMQLIRGSDGIFARIGTPQPGAPGGAAAADGTLAHGAPASGGQAPDLAGEPLDLIKIIGEQGIRLIAPLNSRSRGESVVIDEARHNRTLNLLGSRGPLTLQLLQSLTFGCIGSGGTMSAFASVFKFLGPRQIVLVDADRLERSNANRFFGYHPGDDGSLKVEVVRRELLAFDPAMEIETVAGCFPDEVSIAALKRCDVWVLGPDNNFCRYWAAHYASRFLKPLLELGSGIRLGQGEAGPVAVGSQVRLQLPTAEGKCLVCNGLDTSDLANPLYEQFNQAAGLATGYIKDSDLPTPASVVTINALAATLACRILLAYLSGVGSVPGYVEYDELNCRLRDFSNLLPKRPDCPTCGRGAESAWGWGDALPPALRLLEAPDAASQGTTSLHEASRDGGSGDAGSRDAANPDA